jgi:hypothetical protein
MTTIEKHVLPVWETVIRSLRYTLYNRQALTLIAACALLAIALQALLGFPAACSFLPINCDITSKFQVGIITLLILQFALVIKLCRMIVLNEGATIFNLGFVKKLVLYIVLYFVISMLLSAWTVLLIALLSTFASQQTLISQIGSILLVSILVLSIIFAPIFLLAAAIAVGDKKFINPRKLFALTKGSRANIVLGFILVWLPYLAIMIVLRTVYSWLGTDNGVVITLFTMAGLTFVMLDTGFKGAFLAHIYQFFKFYDTKEQKETKA